jgi:hypothetical protein
MTITPNCLRGRSLAGPHSRYEVATAQSTPRPVTMPESSAPRRSWVAKPITCDSRSRLRGVGAPSTLVLGGTDEEVAGPYPGAELVPGGQRLATMAVSIDALTDASGTAH